MKAVCLLLIFTLYHSAFSQQLTTRGKVIVNHEDQEILLRGMGLGGWMVMEGYMMKTVGFAGTQYEIKSNLIDLMGEEKTELFF